MAYTPPVSTAIGFVFSGDTYSAPQSTAIPFVFADPTVPPQSSRDMIAMVLGPLITGARTDPVTQDAARCYADRGFVMRADCADYGNIYFDARITGDIDASLEVSCVFWGQRSGFSLGQIVMQNTDGGLDALFETGVKGRPVEIRSGNPGDVWDDWNLEYVGIAESIEYPDQATAKLTVANKAASFDRPFQATVYPDTANSSIVGHSVPVTLGAPLNVPPVFLDPGTLEYATGGDGISKVRSQGEELTITTEWTNSGGTVTLLGAPIGRITIDPTHTDGGDVESFAIAVLDRAGHDADVLGDMGGVDTSGYALGFYADSPITCAQVMDRLMDSHCGWWFFGRDGLLHLGQLTAPGVTPDLEVTATDFAHGEQIAVVVDTMPGYSNTCAGLRNYHIHTPGELATALTDPFTQLGADLQQDYRVRAIATGSGPADPVYAEDVGGSDGARVTTKGTGIGTLIVDATDCQTEADRWLALRSVRRAFYWLPLLLPTSVIRTIEPGMTIQVTAPVARRGGDPRFGLDEKLLLVIGYQSRVQSNRILLKCWG